jgi:hypothetical protein
LLLLLLLHVLILVSPTLQSRYYAPASLSDISCFACGEQGHLSRDCANPKVLQFVCVGLLVRSRVCFSVLQVFVSVSALCEASRATSRATRRLQDVWGCSVSVFRKFLCLLEGNPQ